MPEPRTAFQSDVKARCSELEWQTRVELAACYRLIAHYGWIDLIYNHVSARVPGEQDCFLLNAYGLRYPEVCASNLIKIDLNGRILDDPIGWGINQAGFVVHSAVHAARHDAFCVIHTHTEAGVAVSAMPQGLLPHSQQAMWFHERIGYHDYEGVALDESERIRLAANLGPHNALILRNHGLLTAGDSIPAAFQLMYFLESSCRSQVAAMSCGQPLVLPPAEVCERAARQFHRPGREANVRYWDAMLRMLDAEDSSYRR